MILEDMVFQGTVLGPQLWNFFADARQAINSTGHTEVVYADDLNAYKLYAADVSNKDIMDDTAACQKSLHEWGRSNRVSFDPGKESSHVVSSTTPSAVTARSWVCFDTRRQ